MNGIAEAARRMLLTCGLVWPLALGACSGESEGAVEGQAGVGEVARVAESVPDGATAGFPPAPSESADPGPAAVRVPESRRAVEVNGVRIPDDRLAGLERQYGIQILDGAYWYDAASGATGLVGGPTLGFVLPGLALGGPLAADASGGRTGVLVNGRELPESELAVLVPLVGPLEPGRYFVDAAGNAGREGEPPTVHLLALARERGAAGGGDGWYSQRSEAGGNESGGSGYVMGRDSSGNVWSVSY